MNVPVIFTARPCVGNSLLLKRVYLAGIAASLAWGLTACGRVEAATAWNGPRGGNPVIPGYFADPCSRKFGDTYYLY
ncbi:MAG: hypothetical protein WCJ66_12410, partial [Verrucomicrobiota bacterium]